MKNSKKIERRVYVVNGLVCFRIETSKVVFIATYRGLICEFTHKLVTRGIQIESYTRACAGAPEQFAGYLEGAVYERMIGCFDRAFPTTDNKELSA